MEKGWSIFGAKVGKVQELRDGNYVLDIAMMYFTSRLLFDYLFMRRLKGVISLTGSGIFIVNFEHITHHFPVFLLLTWNK